MLLITGAPVLGSYNHDCLLGKGQHGSQRVATICYTLLIADRAATVLKWIYVVDYGKLTLNKWTSL